MQDGIFMDLLLMFSLFQATGQTEQRYQQAENGNLQKPVQNTDPAAIKKEPADQGQCEQDGGQQLTR